MKKVLTCLSSIFTISIASQLNINSAFADRHNFLEKFRNHGDIQGLYEVQAIAAKYIQRYNYQHQTNWVVGEPNLKILVYRCKEEPVVRNWKPKRFKQNQIVVSCSQTVSTKFKEWDINLPVFPSTSKSDNNQKVSLSNIFLGDRDRLLRSHLPDRGKLRYHSSINWLSTYAYY